ncbi:MAG: hypothetical protein JOY61_23575 [Chloroflexi bacterium]|nr:hypothetical protein [Chloroflexota bacterium]
MSTDRPLSTADMAAAARPVERKADDFSERESGTQEREVTNEAPAGVKLVSADGSERPMDSEAPVRRTVVTSTSEPSARPTDRGNGQREPLFGGSQADELRSRWSDVQTGFVDEPRRAVEQADALVAEVMQRLAQVFADERGKLEQQWDRGGDTDTEALRQALRRYRSFFDRLLSM